MTDGLHNQPLCGKEARGAAKGPRPATAVPPVHTPGRISVEQLLAVIQDHHAMMFMADPDSGLIIDVNRSAARFYGYSPDDLRGKKVSDFSQLLPAQFQETWECATTQGLDCFVSRHKLANDELRTVEIHISPVACAERAVVLGIVHDITEHKKCEEDLKTNVASLEELNTALKVILRQVEESREELSAAIVSNIGELILPNLDKLKKTQLSVSQLSLLESIEASLHNISSTFLQKLRITHHKLSVREIEIAALVKEGKSTKEIAERVNISTKTVEFHRNRLRDKLGLKKKKVNLRSHLLTIQ